MRKDTKTKIKAVEQYLSGGTLARTSAMYNVHRNTLWRWVCAYRMSGEKGFGSQRTHTRHWRRLAPDIEKKLIALKEATPSLTIREAHDVLGREGVTISHKGVWRVWQRYGLTGFAREQLMMGYGEYLDTVVPKVTMDEIRRLLASGRVKEAAKVINTLPLFPAEDVILKIPVRYLSLRRRVDRIRAEFGKVPLDRYFKKVRALRHMLDRRHLHYSSLWTGIAECYALMWLGVPRNVLKLVASLKKTVKAIHDPRLRFIILLLEGQAYASMLRIREARACAERIKVIIRSSRNPCFFMGGVGGLYSMMGFFREAIVWTARALKGAAPSYREQLFVNLAGFYTTSGNYQKALSVLRKGNLEEWGFHSRSSIIKAFAYLSKGDFQGASTHAIETMLKLKKEGVRRFLHPATLVLACCHQASGDITEARQMLKEVGPLLRKYDLMHEYLQRLMILGKTGVPKSVHKVPSIYLISLLQKATASLRVRDYRRAIQYAHAHKIFGLFMRLAPFYAELIVHLLRKNVDTGLLKSFLRMPIFYVDRPVFHVGFLGRLRISKREAPWYRTRPSPKDLSFIIHMSLNKRQKMLLTDLYENFWPHSRNPARNLSHVLTRVRKYLGIPPHYIRIHSGLLYWDVVFNTDYESFYEMLAKARLYEQAGEWAFARREYVRAFSLCRGMPFKGMYDDWSERARHAFLNRLESAVAHFEDCCRTHKEMDTYRRMCNRLSKQIVLESNLTEPVNTPVTLLQ